MDVFVLKELYDDFGTHEVTLGVFSSAESAIRAANALPVRPPFFNDAHEAARRVDAGEGSALTIEKYTLDELK